MQIAKKLARLKMVGCPAHGEFTWNDPDHTRENAEVSKIMSNFEIFFTFSEST